MGRLLLVFFVGLISVRTLYFEPSFQHLPPEKLGVKQVNGMCWSDDGTMWLATNLGLMHYDGYSTQVFQNRANEPNTPMGNVIRGVLHAKNNDLWIFYQDHLGVSIYTPSENKFKHFEPDSTRKDAIPPVLLTGFREDSKGRIWITTWGAGLVRFFPETGTFKAYPLRTDTSSRDPKLCPASRIKAFAELPDGRFVLGFFENGHLDESPPYYFDPETETFAPYNFENALAKCDDILRQRIEVTLNIVHFIFTDAKENLWIGTYSGLLHYDTHSEEIRRVTGKSNEDALNLENTRAYAVDEKGFIWTNTINSGLMIIDPETFEATYAKFNPNAPGSLSDNGTAAIKKDPDGNIWVITGTGGFSIYSPVAQQFRLLPWESIGLEFADASSGEIQANQLLIKSHRQLLASSKNGISYFDPVTRTLTGQLDPEPVHQKDQFNLTSHEISDFKEWGDTILFTTSGHPHYYTKSDGQFHQIKHHKGSFMILFRHETEVQGAWFAQDLYATDPNILYGYNREAETMDTFLVLPKGTTISRRYSFQLNDGRWMISGGAKEIIFVDPKTKQHTIYSAKNKDHYFPDSTILTCHLDANETAWVCTEHGLYRFNVSSGAVEKMNDRIALQDEAVMSMITDQQGIRWMALKSGLIRWDEKQNKVFRFTNEIGMMATKFIPSLAQRDEEGCIYMATTHGVFTFNPANIHIPDEQPQLYLSTVFVNTDTLRAEQVKEFAEGNSTYSASQNTIQLEFHTNQIFAPLPHQFSYRISGSDSAWQDNGISNRVRLSNLPHGEYNLEIKVRNAYGSESKPMLLHFSIDKPFWLTWWFILICITGAGALVYLYTKRREAKLVEQKQALEREVEARTSEVVEKAKEIHQQKEVIEEKNKQLTDSILYAQRIQHAILPAEQALRNDLPDHFVFYQPKDIVSGDFYWHSSHGDSILWALVDCTGHGVPGGFMSMLGAGLLNQIVNEEHKLRPDLILNELRQRVILALKQSGTYGDNSDGMDITLCRYQPKENKLQFAGAFNSLYIARGTELLEIKGDKQPIGIYVTENKDFTLQEMEVRRGDVLYMTSDGYADQFGGPKGKKYKTANFEKMLKEISMRSMDEQRAKVESTFTEWKGDYEQVDDICVVGVKL